MKVLKIRKIRNQPFYKMELEMTNEEQNVFIVNGMNVMLREMKAKAVAIPAEKFPGNMGENPKSVEMSDEESNFYLNAGILEALYRGMGVKMPSLEKLFPEKREIIDEQNRNVKR